MTLLEPATADAAHSPPSGVLSSRFCLDLRSLAAFRMAVGLILVADALLRCRDFSMMFTPEGMFPHTALRAFHPAMGNWSLAFLIDAGWWDALILGLEAAAGLALALGFQTRLTSLIAWVAVVSVIRRTAPATNAGDFWLATLLLWGCFLPLSARWSLDSMRRKDRRESPHVSIASVALTLQILVVYLTAGLAKWNATWLSGHAVRDALSIHDHGTSLGAWLGGLPGVAEVAGPAVLALELGGPALFLLFPRPTWIRTAVVGGFMLFHASVALMMTVGLFSSIGLAAWLALTPAGVWDWLGSRLPASRDSSTFVGTPVSKVGGIETAARVGQPPHGGLCHTGVRMLGSMLATCLLLVAIADAVTNLLPTPVEPPQPIRTAVDLACLPQDWEMFGTVLRQEQWAYARGVLKNGREVDLLRGGQPLERERPAGGFTSLPNHRWHKLLWNLPKPTMRVFSPSVAAALANHWNADHPDDQQVRRVEICFARLSATTGPGVTEPGVFHELVVASWPPRDARGSGNLDRWLDEHEPADTQ